MRMRMLVTLAVALGILFGTANGDAPARLWRICAQSELIVYGTVSVPRSTTGMIVSNDDGLAEIHLSVDQTIKGRVGGHITVQHNARDDTADVSNATLLALDGKRVIVFLMSVDSGNGRKWYFAGYRNGIEQASGSEFRDVKAEVARQLTVLQSWRPHGDKAQTAVVRALVNDTTNAAQERDAFRRLEDLGTASVPTIIDLMDDRRSLPIRQIDLENRFPGAFEAYRHYGPEKVVDALEAILNQLTSMSFGTIYNGGTDDERARAVNGWRVYQDVLLNHPDWLR